MTTAQNLIRDLMPLENEVVAVCELLRDLGRCQELRHPRFVIERMFKFEDGSYIRFGSLGPYAN